MSGELTATLQTEQKIFVKNNINKKFAKYRTRRNQWELTERENSLQHEESKANFQESEKVDWAGTKYPWSGKVKQVLKDVFNLETFRAKQLGAINSTLSGQNVIVVMPTGAGKSLCYQLPALIHSGLTVVVSPLISLIQDQIMNLNKRNINAKLITSLTSQEETDSALNDLKDRKSTLKLLYVTPDQFVKNEIFVSNLQKCFSDNRLQRIAIDEVHCCSKQGHDFRPDYKLLSVLTSMLPGVPILGLTATATAYVIKDVQKILKITGCLVIKSTFNRPNLYYRIIDKPESQEDCIDILEKLLKYRYKNESGIIYTRSINDSEEIAAELRKRGLKVNCYHAKMNANERFQVHMKWHKKDYQAIIAAIAFGMGINKPDVRFVIHHSLSKTIQNYYQESGRAGLDGLKAECIIFYRLQDIFKNSSKGFSTRNNMEHHYGMVDYCLNGHLCRRQVISQYFDEDWGSIDCNKMCDVCDNEKKSAKEVDIAKYCKDISTIIEKAENSDIDLTAKKLLDIWFQKGAANLLFECKEPNISRYFAEDIIAFLLVEGYLVEEIHHTAYAKISYLKQGPNMSCIKPENFTLTMFTREFTTFDFTSKMEGSLKGYNCYNEYQAPAKKAKMIPID